MKYKEKRLLREPLLWARECERPMCIPIGRPRGAKAEGLRYERALFRALGEGKQGCWFQFNDGAGEGFCQTDILFIREDCIYILECKLTWTENARISLKNLYIPIVEKAFERHPSRRKIVGIVVCENLVRGIPWTTRVVSTMDEAISGAFWPGSIVLNWRRKTPLFQSRVKAA